MTMMSKDVSDMVLAPLQQHGQRFFDQFLETLRTGRRQQDPLAPNEYRYYRQFDALLPENNHLVVIVVFRTRLDEYGKYISNNFVITGWAQYIYAKR